MPRLHRRHLPAAVAVGFLFAALAVMRGAAWLTDVRLGLALTGLHLLALGLLIRSILNADLTGPLPAVPAREASAAVASAAADGERLRAVKAARLVQGPGGVGFIGAGVGSLYGAEEVAVCGEGRKHTAPDRSCACGFHVLLPDVEAHLDTLADLTDPLRFNTVILDVEVWGVVDEYDACVLASHQRVMGVRVGAWCGRCAQRGRATPSSCVAGTLAENHFLPPLHFGLVSSCEDCAGGKTRYGLPELAGLLGTDVAVDTQLAGRHRRRVGAWAR